VVDQDDRLVGIVTDRDLRSASPWSRDENAGYEKELWEFSKRKVADVMTPAPHTISPESTLQDVLALFRETRVGALPIIDEDQKVVGIVSEADLLDGFLEILGADGPGTFVGIQCEERPDALKRAVDLLTEESYGIGSVLSLGRWLEGRRILFLFLATKNIARARKKLEENGFGIMDPMEWFLKRFQSGRMKETADQGA
jgi:acetoin utilization protein AcuB